MIYNKSVDINIPENEEKGNTWPINRIFVVGLVLLLGIGGFGLQKLYTIEHGREAVSIENTISTTTPPRGLGTPPFQGGVADGISPLLGKEGAGGGHSTTTGTYVAARVVPYIICQHVRVPSGFLIKIKFGLIPKPKPKSLVTNQLRIVRGCSYS
jgi:hypothetical protein